MTCSRELMAPYGTEDANRAVLSRALEHLRIAAGADRAFIFRNLEDHRVGSASAMVAEAVASQAPSHMRARVIPILGDPYPEALTPADMLPWSAVPGRNRQQLAAGSSVGGPLAELFAEAPDFLARLRADPQPALSVQFFPIFCGDEWWGYAGFDDCHRPRIWDDTEVTMLRAAAELFSSTLLRWQAEADLSIRERYQRALAQFSHMLLPTPADLEQEHEILNQALGNLVTATQASRAYVFRNFDDPELGLCSGIHAEACSPGVPPHIQNPANQRFPWSLMSPRMHLALAAGQPYGGPTEEAFADAPFLLEQFRRQKSPLLSVQTVPIHVDGAWWGFIGFDQTGVARRWTEFEVMVLSTAAEMLGAALQRWRAEAQVSRARDDLESQVQARTAELSQRLSVERILAQIAARLISADEPAAAIRRTLSDIGIMTQAGRVVLVHPTHNGAPQDSPAFLEWRASGTPLQHAAGQAERVLRDSVWLAAQLEQREISTFAAARQLPPEAAAFKELLDLDEAAAVVLVPLRGRDLPPGVLICANIRRDPDQMTLDVESLEVVAGLLTGLLAREAYLRTLEQQVADRTRELSVFLDIGLLVSEERRLTEGLEIGLLKIIEAIGGAAGCIHALDPNGAELSLLAAQGLAPQQRARLTRLTLSGTQVDWLARLNPPLLFRSDRPSRDLPPAMRLPAYPHALLAQLRANGEVIGVLSCFARPHAELTINRISLAAAFGEQLGVIVQNHRLQQQARRWRSSPNGSAWPGSCTMR